MAIESSVPHGVAGLWRFPAAIAGFIGLVRAIVRSHRAENELGDLSDRYLRDIGIDRQQIAELVRRESAHNSLLETGWPRRQHRH